MGAGISTSAGIPDFRSPDTGLYANLARLNLPYAEALFDIAYFRSNPRPFFTLAHEIYPGNYRPTVSHAFIRLLSEKGLLIKLFDQNIDCLSRAAGVPENLIVEAHGSFAHQSCIDCRKPYPHDKMKQAINNRLIPQCEVQECKGLVKPDIVFFGEALPAEFLRCKHIPAEADLCIVMGTSLSVQPFASLPSLCPEGIPRLLINKERVGGIGARSDDVLLLGDCDSGIKKFASALGWGENLSSLWDRTASAGPQQIHRAQPKVKSASETWDERMASLADEIDSTLKVSTDHVRDLRRQLSPKREPGCCDNSVLATKSDMDRTLGNDNAATSVQLPEPTSSVAEGACSEREMSSDKQARSNEERATE